MLRGLNAPGSKCAGSKCSGVQVLLGSKCSGVQVSLGSKCVGAYGASAFENGLQEGLDFHLLQLKSE